MDTTKKVHHRAVHWKAILKTQEGAIFLTGIVLAIAILAWFGAAWFVSPAKAGGIAAVVSAHLTMGRANGVNVALGSHFTRFETIVLGSLIEGAVVCLFFSAFCLSCKKLIRVPWLDDALRNVHESAQNQRARLLKWGVPGLILFVWFPFLMTGPVVGSVIGFLLGMRAWVTVAVVMAGTISAIISWTFLMAVIQEWLQKIGNVAPLAFVLLLITMVIAYRYRRYLRNQAARQATERVTGHPPLPRGADETPPEKRRPR